MQFSYHWFTVFTSLLHTVFISLLDSIQVIGSNGGYITTIITITHNLNKYSMYDGGGGVAKASLHITDMMGGGGR